MGAIFGGMAVQLYFVLWVAHFIVVAGLGGWGVGGGWGFVGGGGGWGLLCVCRRPGGAGALCLRSLPVGAPWDRVTLPCNNLLQLELIMTTAASLAVTVFS